MLKKILSVQDRQNSILIKQNHLTDNFKLLHKLFQSKLKSVLIKVNLLTDQIQLNAFKKNSDQDLIMSLNSFLKRSDHEKHKQKQSQQQKSRTKFSSQYKNINLFQVKILLNLKHLNYFVLLYINFLFELMGCTQAKQTVQQIQDQKQKDVQKNKYFAKIIPQQINSHEQNIKSQVNWQQFSQQNDALNILSKDELSSDDFQFLLQNQIWKVQWFEYAISMLKIDQAQAKNHQSQIMKLFLRVKIRQAKFLQSQSQNSILCDQCYDNKIQKFNIKSQFIDDKLFQICKNCSALGWVKNKLSEKVSNCSICSKTINQCKIESECLNCNTFGFKWKPF